MISKEWTIMEVLNMGEKYEKIFAKYLLTCAGCPGATNETLEEAAKSHGVDLECLLADLNWA